MSDLVENWNQEREGIINDTLDTLRDQRDDQARLDIEGTVRVNPQSFNSGRHLVVGPIAFGQSFKEKPNITFGQVGKSVQGLTDTSGGTTYTPFLVMPYIYEINYVNGSVDSFWIGLYALTSVPSGVTEHFVDWRAVGKASIYADQHTTQSWNTTYDLNEPTFLIDEAPEAFDAETVETEIEELGLAEPDD